jgi:hypothetical protein
MVCGGYIIVKEVTNFLGGGGQMGGEELSHAESTDAVLAENLGHLLVGGKVLLVLGVLEVVLLDVGPELLDTLCAAGLLLADDVSELSAQLHGLGESGSLRHDEFFVGVSEENE